ncbi:MAG: hypothetical protein WDN67_01245 [Candidatus Moraniibacteriota bacterium]
MHIHGHKAKTVIDDDRIPVIAEGPGERYFAAIHRVDRRTYGRPEICPVVADIRRPGLAAVSVGIGYHDGAVERLPKTSFPEFFRAYDSRDGIQDLGVGFQVARKFSSPAGVLPPKLSGMSKSDTGRVRFFISSVFLKDPTIC